MKAIQIQRYGGPEMLQIVTIPDPEPAPGEVLVRVEAAAVNPLDSIVRMGLFPGAKTPPLVLGEEAAGIVESDGEGFKAGDKVIVYGAGFGVYADGTWAELLAVPAACLRKIPEGHSIIESAALPNVGVNAYGALRTGDLRPGQTLLVLGASGGIGSAAIQIGKAMGARVLAIAGSAGKAETAKELGADEAIVLTSEPFTAEIRKLTDGHGVDMILDPVGGDITGHALGCLTSYGCLVHLGAAAGSTLTISSRDLISNPSCIIGFNVFRLSPERFAMDYDEIVALAAAKKYRAAVQMTFPATEVIAATRWLEERKRVGKVVLTF